MTQTLERTPSAPFEERSANPVALEEIIDTSLSRVEEMDDAEMSRQLQNLIDCTRRIGLLKYMKDGHLEQMLAEVPNITDLRNKIHHTAEHLLEATPLNADASIDIANLGTASDIIGDKSLLERTLGAIADTADVNVETLVKALTVAHNENRLFTEVYGKVKAGKQVIKSPDVFVPMSKRPDFHQDHPYAHLSTPIPHKDAYKPKHRQSEVPTDAAGRPVTIDEKIFGIEKDPYTGLFADQTKN